MARMATALLVAVTGCNQIFGLGPTVKLDAPADAMPIRTSLVWGAATTDGIATNGIDPVIEYAAIGSEAERPGLPRIQVGDFSSLAEVPYNVADGSFEIPSELRTAPHRIVYTLPGESAPHEWQWSVAGAYIVMPRTTRLGAAMVPPGSGYTIMPAGLTTSASLPGIATSGVFIFTSNPSDFDPPAVGTITFRYATKANAMAGPLGAPQSGRGDWVLVMNHNNVGPEVAVSGWALMQVDLAPNTLTSPATAPAWTTSPIRTLSNTSCPGVDCSPTFNSTPTYMRMTSALGTLAGPYTDRMMYGVSPSLDLPGFVAGGAPDIVDRPLIIPFVQSTVQESSMMVVDPSAAIPLARVFYSGVMTTRTADGVALSSSLQAITNVFMGPMPYPAPLVHTIQLGSIDLMGTSDHVSVPVSSAMRELKFAPEAGFSADDYVVTLYEIAGNTLAPIRIYHVLLGSVTIDGSLLVQGHTYVFGITSRHGLPAADRGDYHLASYPFGVATTFPRTFVIE